MVVIERKCKIGTEIAEFQCVNGPIFVERTSPVKKNQTIFGALLLISMAFPAHATLIGSSVDIVFAGTTQIADCTGVVVGGSVECSGFAQSDEKIDVDIFDSSLVVSFTNTAGTFWIFGPSQDEGTFTIVISGLNWFGDITAVIGSISPVGTGALVNDVSAALTGDNQITITHNDPIVACTDCGDITVGITALHTVPEPSTLALFGIGLAGLGFMTRRRRNRRRQT